MCKLSSHSLMWQFWYLLYLCILLYLFIAFSFKKCASALQLYQPVFAICIPFQSFEPLLLVFWLLLESLKAYSLPRQKSMRQFYFLRHSSIFSCLSCIISVVTLNLCKLVHHPHPPHTCSSGSTLTCVKMHSNHHFVDLFLAFP